VAAVIEQAGRFLVVEEAPDGHSVLNQPAGHLEDRESLAAAIMREVREETAWQFQPEAITGLYRWRHPDGLTFLRVCFSGQARDHDPQQALDPDILHTHWLTRDQVADHSLRSPLVLRCLDDYLAGQRYPLSLCQEMGDEMTSADAAR
jgi:8-oxo-dGTP pyrophosphatase MutT (NUDIX family)